MNKIYIGNTEVANTGSGGGGVSDSSFDELARVTASALLDLKGLEDQIEEFDDKIEGHVEVIDTKIQTLDTNKADSSVVYTKKDIDKADKVTAAALAKLNDRVSTLESSIGGSFDPTDINSSIGDISTRVGTIESNYLDSNDISTFVSLTDVSNFTYNKAHIDASINAITPNFVVMSEADYELITPNPSTLYFLT